MKNKKFFFLSLPIMPLIFSSCTLQKSDQLEEEKIPLIRDLNEKETQYQTAVETFENLENDWSKVNIKISDINKFTFLKNKVKLTKEENNAVFYNSAKDYDDFVDIKFQKQNLFNLKRNDTQTTFIPIVNWKQARYFLRGLIFNSNSFWNTNFDHIKDEKEEVVKGENKRIHIDEFYSGDIKYWINEIISFSQMYKKDVGWHPDLESVDFGDGVVNNTFFSKYIFLIAIKRSDKQLSLPDNQLINLKDLALNKKTELDENLKDNLFDIEFHIVPIAK
ncbi:hypothetical protein [Mycoplasma procyoni]|uniref:hypothetical protein n=1 Tax=Mycoplasma procyoni TaxID=568784 RepID=UPI00197BCD29|nr:hypothetical protein [Mycoplasma procyoni]MBN3535035.1 hypothetical protein [Mycoplasma procyoni]